MPQVKIHISNSIDHESKVKLMNAVREAIPTVLDIDSKIGQVMLYESEYRAIHDSRNKNFIFVEITMYKGRSHELKGKLADAIISQIMKITKVDGKDINLVYYEMHYDNYFGGTSHKYIQDLKQA